MADLSVRRIDDEVVERLKARAAAHGVSTEEEVRRILRDAVTPREPLGQLTRRLFGGEHGVELELPSRAPHDPPEIDG